MIHLGKTECFELGNLNARRDWGHAQDYVEGIHMMLQQQEPEDFVLSSGQDRSVREFVEEAFGVVGVKIQSSSPFLESSKHGANFTMQMARLRSFRSRARQSKRQSFNQGEQTPLPACGCSFPMWCSG